MMFTPEHEELRRSLQKFIAAEVNPHVDAWEEAGIFPAHELFKKLGAHNRAHLVGIALDQYKDEL